MTQEQYKAHSEMKKQMGQVLKTEKTFKGNKIIARKNVKLYWKKLKKI